MNLLTQQEKDHISASSRVRHVNGKVRKAFIAAAAIGYAIASTAELARGPIYHFDMIDPKTLSDSMKFFMGHGKGLGQAMYYMVVPLAIAQEAIMEKALKAKEYAKALKDRSHIAGAMLMTAGIANQINHAAGSGGKNFDVWDVAGYALGVTMATLCIKLSHRQALKPSNELEQKIESSIALNERVKKRALTQLKPT